ncbi:putative diphthamide synthesis protein-domain-containing protein [Peziza echinospora]|nr:putative diphthamide synthesis protein-domain-containing protein [Peziza echinospora]
MADSSAAPIAAPALSTQEDTSAFTDPSPPPTASPRYSSTTTEAEFRVIYEIERTVREIREGGYRHVALQFPDELLGDSVMVYGMVLEGINQGSEDEGDHEGPISEVKEASLPEKGGCCSGGDRQSSGGCCGGGDGDAGGCEKKPVVKDGSGRKKKKVFILADTSYGACCVDEIAAEHVDADVVVHYGKACLSPTSRLPVIHIFTISPLSRPSVIATFTSLFPPTTSLDKKIILMADVTYHSHLPSIHATLTESYGYKNLFLTEIIHDPSSPLPNRTLPRECRVMPGAAAAGGDGTTQTQTQTQSEKDEKMGRLREEWEVFHIDTPLPTLLLVLSSRVAGVHIYPTDHTTAATTTTSSEKSTDTSSAALPLSKTQPLPILPLLRRRYALLTHLRTASIIGILISTLSVKNYLPLITLLKTLIRSAGKKSYLVVVGKVNVEKLANFAEIEGWVGIGCWEQGVVGGALTSADGGRAYFRPVVTPWELGVALRGMGNVGNEEEESEDDEGEDGGEDGEVKERKQKQRKKKNRWEWNGEWITDFESLLCRDAEEKKEQEEEEEETPQSQLKSQSQPQPHSTDTDPTATDHHSHNNTNNPLHDLPESAPPEYNLRTGQYVSDSRPLAHIPLPSSPHNSASSSSTNSTSQALTTQSQHSSLTYIDPVGGVVSPAARFLAEKRVWRGLGSDRRIRVGYEEDGDEDSDGGEEGAVVETGRSGVARGYVMVGEGGGGGGGGGGGKV